jgi:hypothetical protein
MHAFGNMFFAEDSVRWIGMEERGAESEDELN